MYFRALNHLILYVENKSIPLLIIWLYLPEKGAVFFTSVQKIKKTELRFIS